MPWQPGQSGNPLGRAAEPKPFTDAIKRALAQTDGAKLRKIAETLINRAAEGESWAIQQLADRLEGKPKQQIEQSGPDGGPLQLTVVTGVPSVDTVEQISQDETALLVDNSGNEG